MKVDRRPVGGPEGYELLLSNAKKDIPAYYKRHLPHYEKPEYNQHFLSITWPHIWSFNLFLDFYTKEMVKNLESAYIDATADPMRTDLDITHFPPEYLKISISRVEIGKPRRTDNEGNAIADPRMFPRHARTAHITYGAPLYLTFVWNNTGGKKVKEKTVFSGLCPIMVRSKSCHLSEMDPFGMCRYAGEDLNEPGGYFIVNGNERGVRFVVQQRCNYAIGIRKPRFKTRDILYTEYAVSFRGMRRDGTSTNNLIFFTEDHQCVFRILLNRGEWTCPFWTLLKALFPTVQLKLLKEKVLDGVEDSEMLFEVETLWDEMVKNDALYTDQDFLEDRYLAQLGQCFWEGVSNRLPPGSGYAAAGRFVINGYVLVHTDSWNGKLETLLHMWRKLWAIRRGHVPPENVDSFALQEALGPGQLFASVLKDALFNVLTSIRLGYLNEIRQSKAIGEDPLSVIRSESLFEQIVERNAQQPAKALSFFVATGNIRTYQLDLQQTTGWTITADRLNMNRFIAHFRAIHRGAFFAKMRTTEVRKLIGETWGFICPVHTPDGPTCGLLLHLAQDAVIVSDPPDGRFRAAVIDYLLSQGVVPDVTGRVISPASNVQNSFPVLVDGEPVCRLPRDLFDEWAAKFRELKLNRAHGFPAQVELCAFKKGCGAFEGIYLFSYPGRLVRPVRDVKSGRVEWIGPLAQPWLKIACSERDVELAEEALLLQTKLIDQFTDAGSPDPPVADFQATVGAFAEALKKPDKEAKLLSLLGVSKHDMKAKEILQVCPLKYDYVEVTPTSFLSINASFTPLSNHNQSPRNMYQCQMLKQTMGTPYHNLHYRTDNKVYRILFPNRPLVRNRDYRKYDFDPYASGTNAIVAVISYTGFDMEDAMIINKHSMERGFAHGCVYKTKVVEAAPTGTRLMEAKSFVFANLTPSGGKYEPQLDTDGFAPIGTLLKRDSPLYRTEDLRKKMADGTDIDGSAGHVHTYHEDEEAYVDKVILTNPEDRHNKYGALIPCQRALITLRCVRNPIIGDKFASRAGQKGILSLLYAPEDMPFSPSGITPDIVFNPHGFPSRMTIGMIIESMAGKAAAIHGSFQDATPFREFPRQEQVDDNRWVNQCGFNGWTRRGNRYMTEEELADYKVDNPVDYFGKALLTAGYQYYGTEPLYSGIHGVEMDAHIFMGVIYYQRLRHMVSDKWQCRSMGPIDSLTRQPVKGRKRGGGVRLGEMERDALLGHGAAFMLQDRLLNCSDGHQAFVCPKCGSILSPCLDLGKARTIGGTQTIPACRVCDIPCRLCHLPYIFRYVSNELAAMNITIRLKLTECDQQIYLDDKRPLHVGTAMAKFPALIEERAPPPAAVEEESAPSEMEDVKKEVKLEHKMPS